MLVPGTQTATVVYYGVAAGATALEIIIYSDNPIKNAFIEVIKMLSPVKEPFNLWSDWFIDWLNEQIIERNK